MTLANKVAVVTGAGSGLGKASAIKLAREGAAVALLGRTENELDEVAKEIKSFKGKAKSYVVDVAKPLQVERAMAGVAEDMGGIDILFANAGINGVWAPIDELEVEEWQETISTNLSGTFYSIKFAAPFLKKNGGSVIVTASVNGTRIFSNTGATAYSTTKAGQVAMAKMLALELAKYKIRVNVICPGAIESQINDNTEQRDTSREKVPVKFPEGQISLTGGKPGKAEDVADLVWFLASDLSKHISGTEVWIDGTQSLLVG